jgi:hypothetical protein
MIVAIKRVEEGGPAERQAMGRKLPYAVIAIFG